MNSQTELGQYIKSLRNEQNLTLHQVAKDTDIDMTMLSKIERGERLPTIEQVKRLASFFQLNENELLTKLTAEKIVKDYGINETTLNAVQLVEEQITNYLSQKNYDLGN
ncbi:helix-turn-helix domain-containing protein [Hugenholtzia roseola]|uniref:helix-turn-helix domain-containing protein n=1 Tax=Hugenholtzia roseola TaxID=1002 RepID=UPI0004074DBB|nr:helix-turn-helix transcriptional regulator [Hugenholtzia roseola]